MTGACSALSAAIGEPLPGTAPHARTWVVLEQSGSWGQQALRDADLPDGIGPAIAAAAKSAGVGILLARHPDRLARDGHRGCWAWVARASDGKATVYAGQLASIGEVADWDFARIAAGQGPQLDGPATEPLLLACTQGGRDACCARLGRPLLSTLHEALGPTERHLVWEASHIGGHRFAPTILMLPTGAVYGRLDGVQAIGVLDKARAGLIDPIGLRGLSSLAPAEQAADAAVRSRIGPRAFSDLRVLGRIDEAANDGMEVARVQVLEHAPLAEAAGRRWTVTLQQHRLPDLRPESCGKDPVPADVWQVLDVTAHDA